MVDPGLPPGVIDPSVPEAERVELRAPETQESVEFVQRISRPRDGGGSSETLTVPEAQDVTPVTQTVTVISPDSPADEDPVTDILKERPRDEDPVLAAIDEATMLTGAAVAFPEVPSLSVGFDPVPLSAGLLADLGISKSFEDSEESKFDQALSFIGLDPTRAKSAFKNTLIIGGILASLPIIIPFAGSLVGSIIKGVRNITGRNTRS